ncbi:MAG TPA: hypothetical protein VMY59_02870 [Candidatus Thermoplasmatota archaeon]|nr:hypothetical protein [Candidatus Thermoplasmatota archaeon]
MKADDPINPWTQKEEGDHYPVMREWWTCELLFQTRQDNRRWNLMTSFAYERETPSCFFQYVLFDITSKKWVLHKDINDVITKFSHVKNRLDLRYETSSLQGLYPKYHLHVEDKDQELIVDADYTARSLPHWIAQETTQGNLPIGLNFYRYGFLPYCDITGTITLRKESYNIQGKGYLEHAWGNWSYQKPLQALSGAHRTITTYSHLTKWWLSHHRFKIPQRISFTSENNPFGYDWVWGVCDNSWSLFFGNSLFWVSEGPSFGALYVTPDGKRYWEFCDVRFKYNKVLYVKNYDLYYPSDLELTGRLDDKTIHLRFWSTTDSYEYIDPHKKGRFYKAFILSELPGRMQGTFTDKEKTIPLEGQCKIVLLRQAPLLGHNAVNFKFLLPPKGVGVSVELDFHALRKKLSTRLQFAPRPSIHCHLKRIDFSQIPRESVSEKEPLDGL